MRVSYTMILAIFCTGCKDNRSTEPRDIGETRNEAKGLSMRASQTAKAKAIADAQKIVADKVQALASAQAAVTRNAGEIAAQAEELEAAQNALSEARRALAAAQRRVTETRNQLIDAFTGYPMTGQRRFKVAVQSIGEENRIDHIQEALVVLLIIPNDQLPEELQTAKVRLLGALEAEHGMPAARADAARVLAEAIKAAAPVQFEVPVAALRAAVAHSDGDGVVDDLLDAFVGNVPADAAGDIAALYGARDALVARRVRLESMETLRQTLRDSMVANVGVCHADVQGAWDAVQDDADNANLGDLIDAIRGNDVPDNEDYARIQAEAQLIRVANAADPAVLAGIGREIVAARNALLDLIIPAHPPVPIAIVIATQNFNEAEQGAVEGTIAALLQTIHGEALGDDDAVTRALGAFTDAMTEINARSTRTDAEKQACIDLFDRLTPDPFGDAIDVFIQARDLGNFEAAENQLISTIAEIPADGREPVASEYEAYTNAMQAVEELTSEETERNQAVAQQEGHLVALRGATEGLRATVERATVEHSQAESDLTKLENPVHANADE